MSQHWLGGGVPQGGGVPGGVGGGGGGVPRGVGGGGGGGVLNSHVKAGLQFTCMSISMNAL